MKREAWWTEAMKKCYGGIPVKPYVSLTKEAVDKFYREWKCVNRNFKGK